VKRIRDPLKRACLSQADVTVYRIGPIPDPASKGGAEVTRLVAYPSVGPSPQGTTAQARSGVFKNALSPCIACESPPSGLKG